MDIRLLVGSVDLGSLFVDRGEKRSQEFQLKTLYSNKFTVNVCFNTHKHTHKYLLARLFSSSIFPLRWLEVVQASVKVRPFFLSAYLVSRSPTMIPVLLSR